MDIQVKIICFVIIFHLCHVFT